uniref:Lyase_1 domain-containing protein n=1 Tax=Elaeophora elaphi TaxID=1147741 RepID=A0A0R3RIU4_9BILA
LRILNHAFLQLTIQVSKNSLQFHKHSSSKAALHYDELFNYLLWWVAYNEQKNVSSKMEIAKVTMSESDLSLTTSQVWEKYARSILAAIKIDDPYILEGARCVQLRLDDSLGALGCHGLINCPNGLIGLLDAVRLEMSNHHKKVKEISERLHDIKIDKRQFGAFSDVSHYRHVNSHLSQVYRRINENRQIRDSLIKSLTNPSLSSLLRIVRRRLICDQTLIKLYKVLVNSAPTNYTISEADPIVADVIATFKMAYHKVSKVNGKLKYCCLIS